MPSIFREFSYVTHYLSQLPKYYDLSESLKRSRSSTYSTRIPSRVDRLILHHTATDNMSVHDIAHMHVRDNGWPGIAYHIVIGPGGEILLTNRLHLQSYHCKDNNFRSIGIAINHDCDKSAPSQKALAALRDVLIVFAYHFHHLDIFGHSDLGNTLCPGRFYPLADMKSFYNHVRTELSLINPSN